MPDFHVKIEDMIAENDKLACRWVASGTHKRDFFGIPASGKKATWTGIVSAGTEPRQNHRF
jgi:predicted ester cyclase